MSQIPIFWNFTYINKLVQRFSQSLLFDMEFEDRQAVKKLTL